MMTRGRLDVINEEAGGVHCRLERFGLSDGAEYPAMPELPLHDYSLP
jgi:hypothetical protein